MQELDGLGYGGGMGRGCDTSGAAVARVASLAPAWQTPEAPVYVPHHPRVCALAPWVEGHHQGLGYLLPRRQPPRLEGALALLVPSRIWGLQLFVVKCKKLIVMYLFYNMVSIAGFIYISPTPS